MAEAEVSLGPPPAGTLPDGTVLAISSERLLALPDAAARAEVLATLFKLVDAVIAAPTDEKKRRLKKGNETFHKKVGRHEAAVQFLRAVGFVDADDADVEDPDRRKGALLWMPVAYIMRLTDAHHTLVGVAGRASLPAPPLPSAGGGFNPYQSCVTAMDTTKTLKSSEAHKSEADRIREEVRKRQRELQAKVDSVPSIEMRPTAFWASNGRRLDEAVREASAMDEVEHADTDIVKAQVAQIKDAMGSNNSKFENADRKRLAELEKARVYPICVLRISCPDKAVLQGTFRAADTGGHVRSQIEPLLAAHVRAASWFLYSTPPLQKLQAASTLAKAGLAPGANLHLGFDGVKPEGPFLEPGLMAQMGPKPEPPAGVESAGFTGEALGWGRGASLAAAEARREGGQAPSSASGPAPMEGVEAASSGPREP